MYQGTSRTTAGVYLGPLYTFENILDHVGWYQPSLVSLPNLFLQLCVVLGTITALYKAPDEPTCYTAEGRYDRLLVYGPLQGVRMPSLALCVHLGRQCSQVHFHDYTFRGNPHTVAATHTHHNRAFRRATNRLESSQRLVIATQERYSP